MNRLTSNGLILEEIKHILKYEDNQDESLISLYDLSLLIKKERFNFNRMYITNTNKEISSRCNNIITIVNSFNYDKEELILTVIDGEHYKVSCTKENNKLNLQILNTKKHFSYINSHKKEISDIYDEFMQYKDYIQQQTISKTTNSSLYFQANNNGISIFTQKYIDDGGDFLLANQGEYIFKGDSIAIKELITDNEDKIFKNIYVKIDHCPKWTQDKLYEIRKQKLSTTKVKKKIKKHC